jgi:hypothetical protein
LPPSLLKTVVQQPSCFSSSNMSWPAFVTGLSPWTTHTHAVLTPLLGRSSMDRAGIQPCAQIHSICPQSLSGCVFLLHSVRSLCNGAQPRQVMLQQHVRKNHSHPIPSAGLSTMAVDGSLLPDCVQQFTCTVTSTSV